MKAAADVDAVKAAYAKYQGDYRQVRPVNMQALAESLAGQALVGDTYSGKSRMSAIRAAVDYPQLEVTVGALVRRGWLVQISYDEALALPVSSWGLNRNGRYYLSADDLAQAREMAVQNRLAERRSSLHKEAVQIVRDRHTAEITAEYRRLCDEAGLIP